MKLYYAQGACSFSPHIVLHELGIAHEAVKVDLRSGVAADGENVREINPKGYVPVLVLEDGAVLTEGTAIVQYLAELHPEKGLMPSNSMERARVNEWMNYIAMELHKNFGGLFAPGVSDEEKTATVAKLMKRFAIVEKTLENREYLTGDDFTVADAYLFTVASWTRFLGVDISGLVATQRYLAKVAQRPSVIAALTAEGLAG